LIDMLANDSPIIRMSAESALVAISSDDAGFNASISRIESFALAQSHEEPDRLCQLASTLGQMKGRCSYTPCKDLMSRIHGLLTADDVDWDVWRDATSIMLTWEPTDVDVMRLVLARFKGATDYTQQVETLQLLKLCDAGTGDEARHACDELRKELKAVTHAGEETRSQPLAVYLVECMGALKAGGGEVIALYTEILRGVTGDCQQRHETDDLRAAVLIAVSTMDIPPVALKPDVYRCMLQAAGVGFKLWEPAALALRALLDEELEEDKTDGDEDPGHNLSCATQYLEGWLSLMKRSGERESAKAAAAAIMALRQPSDVLAAYLLTDESPTGATQLSRCIHLQDVKLVTLLLSRLVTRNVDQRQCALSVVNQLEITEDYQVCTVLAVLSASNPAGSFLCRGVMEYFRSCLRRNPRWKLPESLHVLLLRQAEADKNNIDLGYILSCLGLSGALAHGKTLNMHSETQDEVEEARSGTLTRVRSTGLGKAATTGGAKALKGLKGLSFSSKSSVADTNNDAFDLYASFS